MLGEFSAIFVLAFFSFALVNHEQLSAPPYWDGVVGVYQQGAWLARHDLDYISLSKQPPFGNGPRLHLESSPALIFAILVSRLPVPVALALLHLATWLMAAYILAEVWTFLIRHSASPSATLWTLALAADPIFSAQCAGIYLEIPLAFISIVILQWLPRERFRWTALLVIFGYTIKATSLLFALALLSWAVVRRISRSSPGSSSTPPILLFTSLVAILGAFYIASGTIDSTHIPLSDRIQRWASLAVQDFPCQIALFFVILALSVRRLYKNPSDWLSDTSLGGAPLFSLILLSGFWASHLIFIHPLTRYIAAFLPITYLLIGLLLGSWNPRAGLILPALILAFNLANHSGALLAKIPENQSRDGHRLERSREWLQDLAQQRALCRLIETEHFDEAIIAKMPQLHMLGLPELGYVQRALPRLHSVNWQAVGVTTNHIIPSDFEDYAKINRALIIYSETIYEINCSPPSFIPSPGCTLIWHADLKGSPLLLYRSP
jgi:hypothetical protein